MAEIRVEHIPTREALSKFVRLLEPIMDQLEPDPTVITTELLMQQLDSLAADTFTHDEYIGYRRVLRSALRIRAVSAKMSWEWDHRERKDYPTSDWE